MSNQNDFDSEFPLDGQFTVNESKSNIAMQFFAAICLSALTGVFIACCSEILFKNIDVLENIDISYLEVIAIGTSVAAPLDVLLLLDLLLPQKLLFDEIGLTRKLLGTKSQMAWSDILKIELKDPSLGGTSESKKTIILSGKNSSLSIMPVFEIAPSKLAYYIGSRAKSAGHQLSVERIASSTNLPNNPRRAKVNRKILLPMLLFISIVIAVGLGILFLWIRNVIIQQ